VSNNRSNEEQENPIVVRARDMLMESKHCAQTSFAVLQEEFHLEGDQMLSALTPIADRSAQYR
jgi:hypothetical protein